MARKRAVAVIPLEGHTPVCQTSRTLWPKGEDKKHLPLLAVGTVHDAIIVLVPTGYSRGDDRRSPKLFASRFLVPYVGPEQVPAATAQEESEARNLKDTSLGFRQNLARTMDVRRSLFAQNPEPDAALAIA